MHVRIFSGTEAPAYVARCRQLVCQAVGIPVDAPSARLVPFATYFVLEDEAGRPVGMAEACFLHQCYDSWEASIYADMPAPPCEFTQLAGIRSVYVEPDLRQGGKLFARLYLAASAHFHQQGARFATSTTWVGRRDLVRLYGRMGAKQLGETAAPDSPPLMAFLFDLERLLAAGSLESTIPQTSGPRHSPSPNPAV